MFYKFLVITSAISTSINEWLIMGWHLAKCNTYMWTVIYLLYSQYGLFIYYILLYTQGLVYAGTPCPIIIILNYESCMNNFFSLFIFETQVYSVSWASLELIIYVSQAGLKKSYQYFWVSLWSDRIILLWSTILCLSEHETHKLLAYLSSKDVSYKFTVRKSQKPKINNKAPIKPPK